MCSVFPNADVSLTYRCFELQMPIKRSSENVITRGGCSKHLTSAVVTHTFMAPHCWSFLLMAHFDVNAEPSTNMLLCLGSFVHRGALEVCVVEEQGKKDQVAEVHERTPRNVVHIRRTAHLMHPVVH